ncbi:Membrane protein involved in the export of O-antigen and teichoic acid [Rhodospirillales bacterium URHD0017]|nr:Membrane protein involved in the export of O-antigen and teichoic acid [Rhodospirillales bacterium URHD0017]
MKDMKGLAGDLGRYLLVTIGPVGAAVSQFALSLVLLRFVDPATFGTFSFLLTASQFSLGISSALFGAVLPVVLADEDPTSRRKLGGCLFATNLAAACVAAAIFFALACTLGVSLTEAGLFAAYAAVALIRWFARSHAYATGRELKTTASDIVYSVIVLVGIAMALLDRHVGLDIACATLLAGALAGIFPFGRGYLAQQFIHVRGRHLALYARIWRRHAGWAFLGVLTTEATANAHVYIVTLIYGPLGFAPIAATALFIRPVGVAMNTLTDYERGRMARQIADDRIDLVKNSRRFLRLILILAWLATALAVALLVLYAPDALFSSHYSGPVVVTGAALWLAVAAIRVLRTPEGTLLQAAGAFRPLAIASILSSGVSITAVLVLVIVDGPLWSIAGILAGELVIAGWIWRQARRWPVARDAQAGTSQSWDARLTGIGPTAVVRGASPRQCHQSRGAAAARATAK